MAVRLDSPEISATHSHVPLPKLCIILPSVCVLLHSLEVLEGYLKWNSSIYVAIGRVVIHVGVRLPRDKALLVITLM